jgi:RimJ/RimL family protein N-acetyltransferase
MIPELTTRRLILRPLVAGDGPRIMKTLNIWDVTRWLTLVPFPYGEKDAAWFLDHVTQPEAGTVWAIDAGDGLIGVISVKPDLGYWLDPAFHGQGYMTEAAHSVLRWYFARSSEPLVSGYHTGNHASRGVLRKLGFRETCQERAVRVSDGAEVVIQRMALSPDGWREAHG